MSGVPDDEIGCIPSLNPEYAREAERDLNGKEAAWRFLISPREEDTRAGA
jgi:hypothetical protein